MSEEERLVRAHDLGISAFLADIIYNFGELVSSLATRVNLADNHSSIAHAPNTGRPG